MKIGTKKLNIHFRKWDGGRQIIIFHPWGGCYFEHLIWWDRGVKYYNGYLPF